MAGGLQALTGLDQKGNGAWSLILLASSQIDWFGPFPGPDMVANMGLARSPSLRLVLYNGWAIMTANVVLLLVLVPALM